MNYGAIGTLIGNDINNDILRLGRMYDKHGNSEKWWTNSTKHKFFKKAKCIVLQYYGYTDTDLINKVSDQEFLDKVESTMHDIVLMTGGFKEAYYAYNSWTKQHGVEQRLPGLQEYTPQQMFWLSAINALCFKSGQNFDTDIYSFQIISSLSYLEDFSNDFLCPLNNKTNPLDNCEVW
uniref:Neprilysin-2 n=1 Tax=Schizaphis graminum TaxID=13262 RepID=A0A2S2NV57_SCHGA